MASNYTLRPATTADEPELWEMLCYAASMETAAAGATYATIIEAQNDPALFAYVYGWGRPGDVGMLAVQAAGENNETGGRVIGAAWLRLPHGTSDDFGEGMDDVPELAIGIAPAFRGQGVGTALLEALIAAVQGQFARIILTVRQENPAVRLYERVGFTITGELVNRVGTKSYVMILALG